MTDTGYRKPGGPFDWPPAIWIMIIVGGLVSFSVWLGSRDHAGTIVSDECAADEVLVTDGTWTCWPEEQAWRVYDESQEAWTYIRK